ncbi:hypothetical protein P4O66_021739 [Electrophorus voltai]|uniref:Uncharacterized protein n=1 Tax=Electrophorus voltai TaxID=2609070 RepID=A0AAD8YN68_9TELE|nr:hypothetical protein P4O66_021739 [Electrophorus voltai]
MGAGNSKEYEFRTLSVAYLLKLIERVKVKPREADKKARKYFDENSEDMLEKAKMWLEEAEKRQKQQVGHRKGNNEVSQCVSLADPDLDAAPPRAPQLIQQPQALANPPPYPQPGTSLTPKPSPYDELRRQLEAITSPVAHRTRSHTTIKPSAEPEVGYAPQFPMVEVSGPEGVIMVHRHWTADDIMKAADGLSKPGDIGGRRFGQELMAFVQSCRPTQAELRRLLMMRKRKRREN